MIAKSFDLLFRSHEIRPPDPESIFRDPIKRLLPYVFKTICVKNILIFSYFQMKKLLLHFSERLLYQSNSQQESSLLLHFQKRKHKSFNFKLIITLFTGTNESNRIYSNYENVKLQKIHSGIFPKDKKQPLIQTRLAKVTTHCNIRSRKFPFEVRCCCKRQKHFLLNVTFKSKTFPQYT